MKNLKKIKGFLIVILLTCSMSCNDDFLQEDPLSFLSPENTFVDAAGLQTALERALKGVMDQWNGDNREIMFNHNMSDATVVSATDKQDAFVDLRTYATPQNSRDNDAGRARSFYEKNYIYIKAANTVIDYIDVPDWEGGATNADRNHLLGSAYFLRSFFYLQLTLEFGNIGFPLNVVSEAKQDFQAFHMQGIWDQMITDLEYAVQHMKTKSQLPIGQAPNAAARMLLSQYYMLNLKFSEAEAQLDQVIASGEHRLFTDGDVSAVEVRVGNDINPFNGNTMPGRTTYQPADAINSLHQDAGAQKTGNPEGIWLAVNEPFILGTQGRSASIRAWGPNFVSTNKGVKAPPFGSTTGTNTSQGKGEMMLKFGRGQGFARPTNYSQYDIWHVNGEIDRQDYRHKPGNWFEMSDVVYDNPDLKKIAASAEYYLQPLRLFHTDGTLLCEDTVRCWYGYPMYKFYAENIEDQVKRQDGGKRDIYIKRKAEAYLLRAEARLWQNNYAGAAEDINTIRQRANAKYMFTVGDVSTAGIGAILDERCRELYGEEYRHDEMVRMSIIFAKSGKAAYNGKTYAISGGDIEKSLSAASFYYDRMIEKNNFFREETPWSTYTQVKYTMDPKHIFWPIYQNYLVGNVGAVLNQTTGYDGAEKNIEPLVHVVQPAGVPNVDPMAAIGVE